MHNRNKIFNKNDQTNSDFSIKVATLCFMDLSLVRPRGICLRKTLMEDNLLLPQKLNISEIKILELDIKNFLKDFYKRLILDNFLKSFYKRLILDNNTLR